VTVAADDDLDVGVRREVGGCFGSGCLAVGTQLIAVVVEENVGHVLVEDCVGPHIGGVTVIGGRDRSLRHAHGNTHVGFGGAAVAFGGEVEVGGSGGRHSLRAVDGDLADTVDGDGGRVGGAPVEDDGLAEIDGERIGGEIGRGGG